MQKKQKQISTRGTKGTGLNDSPGRKPAGGCEIRSTEESVEPQAKVA